MLGQRIDFVGCSYRTGQHNETLSRIATASTCPSARTREQRFAIYVDTLQVFFKSMNPQYGEHSKDVPKKHIHIGPVSL